MRRPTNKPHRYTPHHDEYIPSLAVLQHWNRLPSLPVCVAEVGGKGLGLVARHTLPAGTVVARYEFRVVDRARAPPGDYRIDVTRHLVGKLDAGGRLADKAVAAKLHSHHPGHFFNPCTYKVHSMTHRHTGEVFRSASGPAHGLRRANQCASQVIL